VACQHGGRPVASLLAPRIPCFAGRCAVACDVIGVMTSHRRYLAQTTTSLLALLGLGTAACADSVVVEDDGEDGTSTTSTTTITGPLDQVTTGPDHPPTCEEMQTVGIAAVSAVSGVAVTGVGGGGGADGDGGAGGGTAGGGPAPTPRGPSACTDPQPLVFGCVDTGVVTCGAGFLWRREQVACPFWERDVECTYGGGDFGGETCRYDTDCAGERAYCNAYGGGPGSGPSCTCATACATDEECGEGQLCLCGEGGGRCVNAGCRTNADCGEGLYCASIEGTCGGVFFECQAATDECGVNADCETICSYEGSVRRCDVATCEAAGRPLVVDGRVRLAEVTASAAWAAPVRAAAVTPELTAALAAHWLEVARMEHASVASFAAFALGLLAHGAPPDLVRGAQAAMADEIGHAEMAFGLASRFGGAPVGPGALDLGGGVLPASLMSLLVDTFLEGCIAEGVAAAEASLLASRAVDPAVREVLERIAVEEARHAELAWRTIAWGLERDPGVASSLRDALARAVDEVVDVETLAGVSEKGRGNDLDAHGVMSRVERAALRRELLAVVVRPVVDALLVGPTPPRSATVEGPEVSDRAAEVLAVAR
jgi:hypothetical protein